MRKYSLRPDGVTRSDLRLRTKPSTAHIRHYVRPITRHMCRYGREVDCEKGGGVIQLLPLKENNLVSV
jgi:hypothetical protein